MAQTIEAYELLPDGRVLLSIVTDGESIALEYQSIDDFKASATATKEMIQKYAFLLQADMAIKADPSLGATFSDAFVGKSPAISVVDSIVEPK